MLAPAGAMESVVGRRYSLEQLISASDYPEGRKYLKDVCAFPVSSLVGATFIVSTVAELGEAVMGALAERLPGINWWVPRDWSGPFLKYGILHESLPAPRNETTGEAMALEVYGEVDGTLKPFSDEDLELRRQWREAGKDESDRPRVGFPAKVVLQAATYSNIAYPGVGGVQFYM